MRLFFSLFMFAILAGCAVILASGRPGPAQAQESEIRIVNHSVETNFPTDVKFYVEVAGPDEIEEVRVVMKTIGQTTRSAYRQVEFQPGASISGEAELLTSGNNYVPPGTRLAYSFEVTDKVGRRLRTEDEVFVYLDTRFEWFTVSEGIVTVYYNNPLVESRAEHVLETALASMAITGPALGVNPDQPLHIITYHNYQDMIEVLPFRSQATTQQLNTLGMAFNEERVLMVYSGDRSVTSTTAHEFVHLLVGDALGRAYSQIPVWLNEGLAEYGSRHGGDRDIMNGYLEQAIREGNVRPLWHLVNYLGIPNESLYAYAHGESVVTFMMLEYGEEKMAELMVALTKTFDIDEALTQVYGFDQYGLDSEWRREIGLEPLPRPGDAGKNPLLQNLPQATIAPVLVPTFAPREATPAAPPKAESEPRHDPTPGSAPAAAVVEQPTAEPLPPEPVPAPGYDKIPEDSAGFSPTGFQAGTVAVAFLLVLLGVVLGVVLARRARSSG